MNETLKRKKHLSTFQIIILGFAGVIVIGTLLLMLPISSRKGTATSFMDAAFTATSAVCVTGLVVYDTATHWSYFGQAVLLALIQIGGLGVISVVATFSLLSGRKISLMQRSTMQEAISAPKVGGIVRLTRFAILATLLMETIGMLALLPIFVKAGGAKGVWTSLFLAVSAFCNAGFDVMGSEAAQYVSLTGYMGHPLVNLVIMLLIVIGGIGFLTWDDILHNRHHFKHYRMQSKVILVTSFFLILLPAIFYFLLDFAHMPPLERLLSSLFQSVTARTAGFNTVDLNSLSGPSKAIMLMLMLIGGSPGSTAGGIKTTTFAVLLANLVANFHRKEDAQFFGRRIDGNTVKHAATIFMMYVTLLSGAAVIISLLENLPLDTCLFESVSALGTVGLTLGITPQLGTLSRLILMALMFIGRVGGLTLIFATLSGTGQKLNKLPQEKIMVG